jgi:hypothetical protein
MSERKRLVLDANILIRACLGQRVRQLIAEFVSEVDFFAAEANVLEAAVIATWTTATVERNFKGSGS